jgi:hypothetical protein
MPSATWWFCSMFGWWRVFSTPYIFWGASFFIGDLFEPFVILEVPLFHRRSFWAPYVFMGAFFIRGLFSPCVFRGASFFIRGLCLDRASVYSFNQRARGLIMHLRPWLHFFSLSAIVEYRASFASNFNLTNSMFWGERTYIAASGYIGSASLKTSHLRGLPLWEKEHESQKLNACSKLYSEDSFITHETVVLTNYLNMKTMEIIRIPRMLQCLASGIWETIDPWPCFFHDNIWPDPFWQ